MVPIQGMRFSNPMELKNCLTNYAVKNGYNLYFEKNDSQRLLVRCCKDNKNPSYPFRLWASWMSSESSFQIKSLVDDHNCSRVFKLGSIVTYKWIGKHFKNQLVKNPKMSIRKMKAKVSTKFNLIVSVTQCRNARRYALDEIEGSLIEHYSKVWSYGEEIMRKNPGSTVKIDVNVMPDSTTYFSKMYVCFKGVKDGWIAACRRVIGVDGCFLKGICRGQLLAAMGRDANNHIFPIAWAVVEVENKETWKWFLDLLLDDIEMGIGHGLTLISDQHKGLIEAVKERVPVAEHRQCARHIYANFKKRFKELLIFLGKFWGVPSGIQQYEVRIGIDGYVVDLNNNTCGCRSWQVSGIPCVHAVAAISYLNRNAEDYVAPWFHTTMFLTCYNHTINPLNGSSMWPEVTYMKPLPPQKTRLPGRPTIKRKRDQSERESQGKTRHTISKAGAVIRCTICRETCHNRSTFPTRPKDAASTSLPKKKKANKCKTKKGTVEPVQVDPIQVEAPAQPDNDVQVDDPAPHVDVHVDDHVNDVPAQHVDVHVDDPVNDVPAQHVDVHVDDPVNDVHAQHVDVHVDDPVYDVPAQPVATGKRTRKCSERITKIGLRRNVLKKEGSIDHHPLVLE
ncbi:unnamed protein product [Lactuca saligna]|uniref:SWIM-type domain-containing protein n=1 Tax=Lactuca saligna TaxID=75948 RepID=A0AA36DW03_LACSI|nr:unnamed protein product [Lactuca saligna]